MAFGTGAGGPAGVAERLYYDSPVLEFDAAVTDIRLVATERGEAGEPSQLWQVALNRTAFYPESGGQPPDTGVLIATARSGATLAVPVERVEEDDTGEVWHHVRKPLVEGTAVVGRIDAERRRDHTQQHSGQHLLSAVFLKELEARTVSFHLGAESSTVDLALPEGMKDFTPEQLATVEDGVNRLIYENRAVVPRWHTRDQAEMMLAGGLLRKLPERSGPMRVVEMQGVEFNACGGTHVAATGAIGGLLLRRLEKVKAGWRVEFVCGLRAMRAARREHGSLAGVAALLSVGTADVTARVAALQEEAKAAGKARRASLDELAEAQGNALLREFHEGQVAQAIFAEKPVEFAKRVAATLAARARPAVVGVTESGQGAVALALPAGDPRHGGNLLREVFGQAGARGGGSAALAQGVCRADQVEALLRSLSERVTAR